MKLAATRACLFIDRNFSPAIADLVQFQHIHLGGLTARRDARLHPAPWPGKRQGDGSGESSTTYTMLTGGRPYVVRLVLGLMVDLGWEDLAGILQSVADQDGSVAAAEVVAFAVENFASIQPQTGPLLNRLVSAAGGASLTALRDLFWTGLGSPAELDEVLAALVDRALLELDLYQQRVVLHPIVRTYVEQNAIMLGEEWERRHASVLCRSDRAIPVSPLGSLVGGGRGMGKLV